MLKDPESESDDNSGKYTWTTKGLVQLYKIVHLIKENFLIAFPVYNNERLLHPIFFDMLIDKLRAMF